MTPPIFYLIPLFTFTAVAFAIAIRLRWRRIMVLGHQKGLFFRKGRLWRVVEPGTYRVSRFGEEILAVDTRERAMTLETRDFITADLKICRASLRFSARTSDAYKSFLAARDPFRLLSAEALLCIDNGVRRSRAFELAEAPDVLARQVETHLHSKASECGLELTKLAVEALVMEDSAAEPTPPAPTFLN